MNQRGYDRIERARGRENSACVRRKAAVAGFSVSVPSNAARVGSERDFTRKYVAYDVWLTAYDTLFGVEM